MALPALLLTLMASALAPQAAADDLAALTAPDAALRELATRRLCGRLPREQEAALLKLAVGADFELERRITRVLAARDERLGLVVELLTSRDRRARAIGRASFHELLVRWEPDYDDPPLPSHKARALLRASQLGLFFVPPCEGINTALLERISEGVNMGAPLVLDPGIDVRDGSWASATGAPLELLERLCLEGGLSYELRGPESVDGVIHPGLGHWLRVCSGRDATGASTVEVLIAWALEVAAGGEGAARAARALATTGWSAPVAWFEERWRRERDPVALSGLLAAAARGRVALVLTEAGTHAEVRALLEQLAGDRERDGASWEVERIARGMAEARALGPGGADPSVAWGGERSSNAQLTQWARLVVLEGHRRGDETITREALAAGGAQGLNLWRRALGAYVADPERDSVELSLESLESALSRGHRDGLARALYLAGLGSSALDGVRGAELLRAELHLRAGEEEACGDRLVSAWRGGAHPEAELEALLSRWCSEFGRGRVARALSAVAPEEDEGARWSRLLELSGVLAPGASGAGAEDLQLIACRAGEREGALVRSLLLEELEALDLTDQERLEEFAEAWRRVGWALQEAGDEGSLQTFAAQTRLVTNAPEVQEALLAEYPPSPRGRSLPLDVGLLRVEDRR